MTGKDKVLNVLLYCNRPAENQNAGTVVDHIDAFSKYSRNNILVWSSLSGLPDQATMDGIDCIVIHYTLSLLYENYIPRESFQRIRDFKGPKVLFIQDKIAEALTTTHTELMTVYNPTSGAGLIANQEVTVAPVLSGNEGEIVEAITVAEVTGFRSNVDAETPTDNALTYSAE